MCGALARAKLGAVGFGALWLTGCATVVSDTSVESHPIGTQSKQVVAKKRDVTASARIEGTALHVELSQRGFCRDRVTITERVTTTTVRTSPDLKTGVFLGLGIPSLLVGGGTIGAAAVTGELDVAQVQVFVGLQALFAAVAWTPLIANWVRLIDTSSSKVQSRVELGPPLPCQSTPLASEEVRLDFLGETLRARTDGQGTAVFDLFPVRDALRATPGFDGSYALTTLSTHLPLQLEAGTVPISRAAVDALRESLSDANLPPPRLRVDVLFSDASAMLPNRALDAHETAKLEVRVSNEGSGPASNVRASLQTNSAKVSVPPELTIGRLLPGESWTRSIDVAGSARIADGDVNLTVTTSEGRGYSAPALHHVVATRRLRKPNLTLTEVKIRDGHTAASSGNRNAIIENGESVTVMFKINNDGTGPAVGVVTAFEGLAEEIEIVDRPSPVPMIPAGDHAVFALRLRLPPTFDTERLFGTLEVTDRRGPQVGSVRRKVDLPHRTLLPRVSVKSAVVSDAGGNGNGVLESGESAEIQISLQNIGTRAATGLIVEVRTEPENWIASNSSVRVPNVPPAGTASPTFTVRAPRIVRDRHVSLVIRIRDDLGLVKNDERRELRFRRLRPKLHIESFTVDDRRALFADNDGDNALDRGERVQLRIGVRNVGNLPARELHAELRTSPRAGIRLVKQPKSRNELGVGESCEFSFTLDVQHKLVGDTLTLEGVVNQAEFPGTTDSWTERLSGSDRRTRALEALPAPTLPAPQTPAEWDAETLGVGFAGFINVESVLSIIDVGVVAAIHERLFERLKQKGIRLLQPPLPTRDQIEICEDMTCPAELFGAMGLTQGIFGTIAYIATSHELLVTLNVLEGDALTHKAAVGVEVHKLKSLDGAEQLARQLGNRLAAELGR